ncbi:MAG: LCP family protein [Ruminococcus sp.]|uniref:LCP family glycopolymer transferase n=1 Tax=Ruminococcus sp. TaxID=41978 RepID=UPI001B751E1C|nr:LCP family protein [Ruminococcus sp.]MBP5577885.1 LCP family protein [Ruminococcus sp.]
MAKKTGHVAVPFLLTIFIGLLILGGGAMFAWNYWGLGKSNEPTAPVPRKVGVVSEEDNHTLLLVLEPQEYCPPTFVLVRSMPIKKQLVFIGIPSNTIAIANGGQASLIDSYNTGGAESAAKFVESVFGEKIDKYAQFNGDAFKSACDIFGGVSYPVNADIAGFKNDGSNQYLNSDQALTFVTYTMFKDGESERAFTASSLISSMVNQADGQNIAGNLDLSFNTVINKLQTNITSVDFKEHKNAIKFMFEHGNSIAVTITVDGVISGSDFIISESFIKSIQEKYFGDKK